MECLGGGIAGLRMAGCHQLNWTGQPNGGQVQWWWVGQSCKEDELSRVARQVFRINWGLAIERIQRSIAQR